MTAWLSEWLRDIIAIILLAVLVELLLPNKSMQRYVRLVVGLFILLTILSPVLKLVQSDITASFDKGMAFWSESAMKREVPMRELAYIQQDAGQLSEKRNMEAAKLVERTLEDAMKTEVLERTQTEVEEVDVVLKWVAKAGSEMPFISQVVVTLRSADQESGQRQNALPVEDVLPVAVNVDIERNDGSYLSDALRSAEEDTGMQEVARKAEEDEGWSAADPAAAAEIASVIKQGWGIGADQLVIRQRAGRDHPQ